MHIYNEIKAAGIPTDNHESDLYVKATAEAREILNRNPGIYRTTFICQTDKEVWFDIPFMFLPWWEAKLRTHKG